MRAIRKKPSQHAQKYWLLGPQGNKSFSGGILASAKNSPASHLLNFCHKYKNTVVVTGTGARKVSEIYFRREERATSHRRNEVRREGQLCLPVKGLGDHRRQRREGRRGAMMQGIYRTQVA